MTEDLLMPFVCMYRILSDGDEIFVLTVEHPDKEKALEGFRRVLRKRSLSVRWGKKESAAKSLVVTVSQGKIPEGKSIDLSEVQPDEYNSTQSGG